MSAQKAKAKDSAKAKGSPRAKDSAKVRDSVKAKASAKARDSAAAQVRAPVQDGAAVQDSEQLVATDVLPAEAAPARAPQARGTRTLTGRVVSSRMPKTIAVEIERLVRHSTYGKYIRRTTKLLAHDEDGASQEGDVVTITPCRPMSRRKSWKLLEVVQKAAPR